MTSGSKTRTACPLVSRQLPSPSTRTQWASR